MYHSSHGVDQYSWHDAQNIPFTFPSSPASSSVVSPQMLLDLYGPTSTPFFQNSFKELDDLYAHPCADVSTPPDREDVLNALSQLYSANPRLPGRSARQIPSGQQVAFGDNQSPLNFDIDNLFRSPAAYKNHNPAPNAPISVPEPPQAAPPGFLPHPPPPTTQTSFPQNSQLGGRNFLTCPIPSESVSKLDDPFRQEDSRVTAPPPKRQLTQRASGRPLKKPKACKADNDDGIVLLPCCMTVKPESLARHLKSDGHKRNAGLPLDRPEVCSYCNIAFARQDARNRHFRSQHGGDPPPATSAVYKRIKKPSATHPSLLPKRRK